MNKNQLLFMMLFVLSLFLASCGSNNQINKIPDDISNKTEQTKVIVAENTQNTETIRTIEATDKEISAEKKYNQVWNKFFLSESGLSVDKSIEWMNFFRTIYVNNIFPMPEFQLNQPIENKILLKYILYYLVDRFFYNKTDNLKKDEVFEEANYKKYNMTVLRVKKEIVEKEASNIFGQKVQKNETADKLFPYEDGYYWIMPFGDEGPETVLIPRIVHYIEKQDGTLEFKIEYYRFSELESFRIENESDLTPENLYGKLNETTCFQGTPFNRKKVTLKKLQAGSTSRYIVIENTNYD
jgi:hypothetical protein